MVKVIYVEPRHNYRLFVKLSNGLSGIFDVKPYLDRGVFTELKDEAYFRSVKIMFGGVAWPHEQDFSAHTIEDELQSEDMSLEDMTEKPLHMHDS